MAWLQANWQDVTIKALTGAGIVLVAIAIWRALQKPLDKLGDRLGSRKASLTIFKNILRAIIWIWAACAIADLCFGIDMAGVIGALGIVGIAVSLGAQQTISNVIGGIIVSLSTIIRVDDWIVIQGLKEGRVVDTNWRSTMLEDEDGLIYVVPNSVMVSNVVTKGLPFYTIVIPFALKPKTPDVAGLLRECERAILDAQVASGTNYEDIRPKAHVEGTSIGAIECEVKIYANRALDSRSVKRLVLAALIDFLQEKDALAEIEPGAESEDAA